MCREYQFFALGLGECAALPVVFVFAYCSGCCGFLSGEAVASSTRTSTLGTCLTIVNFSPLVSKSVCRTAIVTRTRE